MENKMWSASKSKIGSSASLKIEVLENSKEISFKRIVSLWQSDVHFRQFFIDLLTQSPFAGFRWECPAVTSQTIDLPFEFVLIEDPYLARRRPGIGAFKQHFNSVPGNGVVTFSNLGGDATLVVPEPITPEIDYGHLGAFCRLAPKSQQHELWRSVGEAVEKRIDENPVWLNTAGGGVPWLHVRLDNHPKYYRYTPYRSD
ncbi:MAG: hypothetical protein AAF902_09590 [Chloroflexota bacterium]